MIDHAKMWTFKDTRVEAFCHISMYYIFIYSLSLTLTAITLYIEFARLQRCVVDLLDQKLPWLQRQYRLNQNEQTLRHMDHQGTHP